MKTKSLRSCVRRLSIGQCLLKQDQPLNCVEFYINLFVQLNDQCHGFDAAKLLSTRCWGCVPFRFHGNVYIYTYLILDAFLGSFFAKGVYLTSAFSVFIGNLSRIHMLNMISMSTLKGPHVIVSPQAPVFSGPALASPMLSHPRFCQGLRVEY